MEREKEVVVTKETRLNRIQKLSKIFNYICIINVGVILAYAIYLFLHSSQIITGFSENMFYRIPYVGELAFLIVKQLNVLDLPMIQSTLQPVLLFEIIYYTVPLMIFQLVLFVLKKKVVTKDNSYFSFIFIYIIVFALAVVKQLQTLLIFSSQATLMEFRGLLIMCLLIAQLICMSFIAYELSKIEKFNIKGIFTHQFAHRLSKTGMIISILILGILGSGLFVANSAVEQVKDKVTVSYVFDLKEAADGTVNIVLPKQLTQTSKLFGVDLPDTLKGGDLVEHFYKAKIDFGAMVSQVLTGTIDSIAKDIIVTPLINVTTALVLIALAILSHYLVGRIGLPSLALYVIQLGLVLFANIVYSPRFGIIVSIGLALLLLGGIFHVLTDLKDTNIAKKVSHLKRYLHQIDIQGE